MVQSTRDDVKQTESCKISHAVVFFKPRGKLETDGVTKMNIY